jgi:AcrR family transcriptional regulator
LPDGTLPEGALAVGQPAARTRRHGATRHGATGRRIAPEERERMIVREATRFFAEHGFEGQTRELARRLGITQPLLYRYFPDKQALIDRVCQEVFQDRWSPQWQAWIGDRSCPLPERLTRFYQDCARVILTYEWVRLYVFSGLKGVDTTRRYADALFGRVYPSVIGEIRMAQSAQPLAESPMTDAEAERLWSLHGAIFYLGVRRWIYQLPVPADQDAAVAARVAAFLADAPGALRAVAW